MRVVHWFRNDLRLHDNAALGAAARGDELIPLFVLDRALLTRVHVSPPRRRFLADSLASLAANLAHHGSRLIVRVGNPHTEVARLLDETRADRLTFNRDYTPYARRRDAAVRAAAAKRGVAVDDHKDRVVFEHDEIRTQAGGGFVVFTPFRNAWLARWRRDPVSPHRAAKLPPPVEGLASAPLPDAATLGAADDATAIPAGGEAAALKRLQAFLAAPVRDYARDRDRPDVDGTSRLSPHLRFGTISIRRCVHAGARARGDRTRAPRPARPSGSTSSSGANSTPPCSPSTRACSAAPSGANSPPSPGTTTMPAFAPGARAAPAIPSSTPPCASSCRPAGCTIAPA